jgi:hypothetical protein
MMSVMAMSQQLKLGVDQTESHKKCLFLNLGIRFRDQL